MIYCCAFFVICLLPFALMLVKGPSQALQEGSRLQLAPSLKIEGKWNTQFLPEAGAWYEDHFALRNEMITANARLYANVFDTSTSDRVVVGEKGWLYYADSLPDYLGEEQLSDREIFAVAHNLALFEQNLSLMGIRFVFAVAPNKNTLYPEFMPYYYSSFVSDRTNSYDIEDPDKSDHLETSDNLDRLEAALEKEGVTYVSLKKLLSDRISQSEAGEGGSDPLVTGETQPEYLYHAGDSHWNNVGAAMAAAAILDRVGQPHADWEQKPTTKTDDFTGDLSKMLYPASPDREIEYVYPGITDASESAYCYVNEVTDNYDPMIQTVSTTGTGSVVMFRDSFGNALLPFVAASYAEAFFTRGVPWNSSAIFSQGADTVISVKAQRFIPEMLQEAPVIESLPVFDPDLLESLSAMQPTQVPCSLTQEGYLIKISGEVPTDLLQTKTRIVVKGSDDLFYEAFLTGAEADADHAGNGFVLYMQPEKVSQETAGNADPEFSVYFVG